jgi:hypothetical protein
VPISDAARIHRDAHDRIPQGLRAVVLDGNVFTEVPVG